MNHFQLLKSKSILRNVSRNQYAYELCFVHVTVKRLTTLYTCIFLTKGYQGRLFIPTNVRAKVDYCAKFSTAQNLLRKNIILQFT